MFELMYIRGIKLYIKNMLQLYTYIYVLFFCMHCVVSEPDSNIGATHIKSSDDTMCFGEKRTYNREMCVFKNNNTVLSMSRESLKFDILFSEERGFEINDTETNTYTSKLCYTDEVGGTEYDNTRSKRLNIQLKKLSRKLNTPPINIINSSCDDIQLGSAESCNDDECKIHLHFLGSAENKETIENDVVEVMREYQKILTRAFPRHFEYFNASVLDFDPGKTTQRVNFDMKYKCNTTTGKSLYSSEARPDSGDECDGIGISTGHRNGMLECEYGICSEVFTCGPPACNQNHFGENCEVCGYDEYSFQTGRASKRDSGVCRKMPGNGTFCRRLIEYKSSIQGNCSVEMWKRRLFNDIMDIRCTEGSIFIDYDNYFGGSDKLLDGLKIIFPMNSIPACCKESEIEKNCTICELKGNVVQRRLLQQSSSHVQGTNKSTDNTIASVTVLEEENIDRLTSTSVPTTPVPATQPTTPAPPATSDSVPTTPIPVQTTPTTLEDYELLFNLRDTDNSGCIENQESHPNNSVRLWSYLSDDDTCGNEGVSKADWKISMENYQYPENETFAPSLFILFDIDNSICLDEHEIFAFLVSEVTGFKFNDSRSYNTTETLKTMQVALKTLESYEIQLMDTLIQNITSAMNTIKTLQKNATVIIDNSKQTYASLYAEILNSFGTNTGCLHSISPVVFSRWLLSIKACEFGNKVRTNNTCEVCGTDEYMHNALENRHFSLSTRKCNKCMRYATAPSGSTSFKNCICDPGYSISSDFITSCKEILFIFSNILSIIETTNFTQAMNLAFPALGTPVVTMPERTDSSSVEIIMEVTVTTNTTQRELKASLSKWMATLLNCKEDNIQITISNYPALASRRLLQSDTWRIRFKISDTKDRIQNNQLNDQQRLMIYAVASLVLILIVYGFYNMSETKSEYNQNDPVNGYDQLPIDHRGSPPADRMFFRDSKFEPR